MFSLSCCINLARREERWREFQKRLPRDWPPGKTIRRYPAIEGARCPPPDGWKESGGAWGCFRSHLRILEDCLNNNVESVVVFEDDATFAPNFTAGLHDFLSHVPANWHMLYLGGQLLKAHFRPPQRVNEHVYRPFNVNRSHAYALSGEGLRIAYRHLCTLDWYENYHVDHHMGRLHEDPAFRVYCPPRWLVGQLGGPSDISGQQTTTTYWNHAQEAAAAGRSPLVLVLGLHESGAGLLARALHERGLFFGDELQGMPPLGGGECQRLAGLCERVAPFPWPGLNMRPAELRARLGDWLGHHLWRAEGVGKCGAACYPHLAALAPLLREFCGSSLQVVYVHRPLDEAIAALCARSRTASGWIHVSDEQCAAVQRWLLSECESFLQAVPHHVVEYEAFVANCERETDRAAKFLGLGQGAIAATH